METLGTFGTVSAIVVPITVHIPLDAQSAANDIVGQTTQAYSFLSLFAVVDLADFIAGELVRINAVLAAVGVVAVTTINEAKIVVQSKRCTAFNANSLFILCATEVLGSAVVISSKVVTRCTFMADLSYVIDTVLERFEAFSSVQMEAIVADDASTSPAFETVGDLAFPIYQTVG